MSRRLPVFGLDIETDTLIDGLDPSVSMVRCAVLSFAEHDEIFSGRESLILTRLDRRLASLPAGLLATWNGALFDLPFLVARARALRVDLGLRLAPEGASLPGFPVIDGHQGSHRGAWYHQSHLDTHHLYGDEIAMPHDPQSRRRRLARRLGWARAVTDEVDTDTVRREVEHACAARDARLARVLTERRRGQAARLADRLAPPPAVTVAPAGVVGAAVPAPT